MSLLTNKVIKKELSLFEFGSLLAVGIMIVAATYAGVHATYYPVLETGTGSGGTVTVSPTPTKLPTPTASKVEDGHEGLLPPPPSGTIKPSEFHPTEFKPLASPTKLPLPSGFTGEFKPSSSPKPSRLPRPSGDDRDEEKSGNELFKADKTFTVKPVKVDDFKERIKVETERRIKVLEALIEKVKSNDSLTEEQKEKIIVELQAQITKEQSNKEKATKDTKLTDVKKDATETKKTHEEFKTKLPKAVAPSAANKLAAVVKKLENAETTLQKAIDSLKAAGQDTTGFESEFAKIKTDIATVKANAAEVKTLADEIAADGTSADTITKDTQKIKELMTSTIAVINTLKTEIKTLIQHMAPPATPTVEASATPEVTPTVESTPTEIDTPTPTE